MMQKNIIAIIPARGGSKGIPGKNIMDFCGKPLLAWSILQAKATKTVKQVYVSSDDLKILDVAVSFGALPIIRPAEFATDTATSEQVLLHAIGEIEKLTKKTIDLVVFLQATSPLRTPEDIDESVKAICDAQADSLFSMAVLDDFCVWFQKENNLEGLTFNPFNRGRRQDREPLYLENGSIYIFKPEILRKYNNRLGGKIVMYAMDGWKSYEIDRKEDLDIFEYFFKKNLLDKWTEKQITNEILTGNVDLIVYDFDGVMTDNRVLVSQEGVEFVTVNRGDGLGADMIRAKGIPQIIISTETNLVVRARAKKLKIDVIDACNDKKSALLNYCAMNGYLPYRVIFVGNDINDLGAMNSVGFPIAPFDAHPDVKAIAKIITKASGGAGVIRELADYLIDEPK